MSKYLVIGANAFSGQDFVDLLLDNPANKVMGASRSPERSSLFLKYKSHKNISNYKYYQLDMNRNMGELIELIEAEKPEFIVNFAAQSEVAPSWEHPEHWFQTNTVALSMLINFLRKQSFLKRYMHISSPEVYGTCVGNVYEDAPLNPSTPYAASKAAADLLLFTFVKQFDFPLVMVRSTNVYGAGQQLFKIIPRSVIYIKLGKKIELHGGGVAVKSYIHIRDISRGEFAVLNNGKQGHIYHLSPDKGIAVKDVVRLICDRMSKRFEDATTVVEERPGQDAAYVIDSTRARKELGWAPTITMEEGLSEVVDWVEKGWSEITQCPIEYIHKP